MKHPPRNCKTSWKGPYHSALTWTNWNAYKNCKKSSLWHMEELILNLMLAYAPNPKLTISTHTTTNEFIKIHGCPARREERRFLSYALHAFATISTNFTIFFTAITICKNGHVTICNMLLVCKHSLELCNW